MIDSLFGQFDQSDHALGWSRSRAHICWLSMLILVPLSVPFRPLSVIMAAETHALTVSIDGSQPHAVRATVLAGKQSFAPEKAVVRKGKKGKPYFYAPRQFVVQVPAGEVAVVVAAGIEFIPEKRTIKVQRDTSLKLRLERWSNLPGDGWYAGDSHVHLHTGGPIQVTTRNALLAAQAEGIHFVNLCVSNNTGDDIRDEKMITGKPHEHSTDQHLLVFGEEMRSMIYGHMQFFGIRKFVQPQYTGFKGTPHEHDYPANYVMAAEATRQGGVVTYGHPMFTGKPSAFDKDLRANNAAARELPVDAMLGVVHAVDIMSYNSDEDLSTGLWYKLLNCGLRLSACVGTDALLDRSTDPMGGSRVYVSVTGEFTQQSWLDGLKQGRTFVTNGPVPMLTLNGRGPGSTVALDSAQDVGLQCDVKSGVPIERVELIVNGKVVRTEQPTKTQDGRLQFRCQFAPKIHVSRSSWVALRVRGPDAENVFDGPSFAHTSPIFVAVDDQPIQSREDAAYFVQWIDQLLQVVRARNGYANDGDRMKVEAIFRKAQDKYRAMAKSS